MPSVESSRRFVAENIKQVEKAANHDAILPNLQAEIDKHNQTKEQLLATMSSSDQDRKRKIESRSTFRFKERVEDPHKKKRRKHRHQRSAAHLTSERHQQQKCTCFQGLAQQDIIQDHAPHPFPRESSSTATIDPFHEPEHNADEAFRESLFDALADDEAANYWESVYGDPIHNYFRPVVENEFGLLERMDDETYANHVKQKMWERKHPDIVLERERREHDRLAKEHEKAKRKQEFLREVNEKERAWDKYQQRQGAQQATHEPSSDVGTFDNAPQSVYTEAWAKYQSAWDILRVDLAKPVEADERSSAELAATLPWPVLEDQKVKKEFIESFLWNAPCDGQSRLDLIKRERVRWHPDKVQQRFGSRRLDEGTMKTITGVFRVIDGMVEMARSRLAPV